MFSCKKLKPIKAAFVRNKRSWVVRKYLIKKKVIEEKLFILPQNISI